MGCWEGDVLTVEDIENIVHHIKNSIISAYEKACPLRRVKPGQKTHRASDIEAYRTAVHEYNRALRREERSS
jgi:hypothetical protein